MNNEELYGYIEKLSDEEYEIYQNGYEQSLDDHNILHGDEARKFLDKMKETETKKLDNQKDKENYKQHKKEQEEIIKLWLGQH